MPHGAWHTRAMEEIGVDDLKVALEAGAVVVDVREADEYAGGRIPGAISAPLSDLASHVEVFRAGSPVYVVCQAGGRSARAIEALADAGIVGLVNVVGGTGAWKARNYPLEVG